VIGMYWLHM